MAAFSTLVEPFNGSAFDSKWSINQNNGGYPDAGEAVVSGGAAILRNTNTTAYDNDVSIDTVDEYDLTGSAVYGKFEFSAISAGAYSGSFVLTKGTQPNAIAIEPSFGFFMDRSTTTSVLGFYSDTATAGEDSYHEITYNATDHAWWQFAHVSTDILFQTAPDASGAPGTWTTQHTVPLSSWDEGITALRLKISYRLSGDASAVGAAAMSVPAINTSSASTVTHATTGVLAASGARTVASSNRFRAMSTSGVLAAGGARTVGTAVHNIPHATSGALAASGARTVSAAQHNVPHATSGVLAAVRAALAGSASRKADHATSGVLAASDAVMVGTDRPPHPTTGALSGRRSAVKGRASRTNPANLESIQDSFDAATVDTTGLWDVVADLGTSASQAGGKLVLAVDTADDYRYVSVTSKAAKRLTGNRVYARMTDAIVTANNVGGAEAGLRVILDANNYLNWLQNSDGTLQAQHSVAGSYSVTVLSYTPATHAWLAFSERGGTVYWESAPSSAQDPPLESEWVTRFSAAPGFALDSLKVRLTAGVYDPAATGIPTQDARFDCINTRTRGAVAHATSGALAARGALARGAAAKRIIHGTSGALVAQLGRTPSGAQDRYHDHPTSGVLATGSAIMSGIGSTSDATRKVWFDAQDTGGAWINPPAPIDDPWTPRPDSTTSWA